MRNLFFSTLFLAAASVWAAPPRYHVNDPAVEADLQDLAQRIATHRHNNDGSVRLDPLVVPPRSAIQNSMTPQTVGQVVYNSVDKELCMSTGTLSSQWVKVQSPTTACGH